MTLSAAQRLELQELGYEPDEPDLLDRLVAEQVADFEWLERIEQAYPMACSVLWRAEEAPCDQRRSVLAAMRAPVVTLVRGGERCLAYDTPVLLADGSTVPIGEIREPVEVLAWDGEGFVPAYAEPHPRKGPDPLYRVTLSDGSWFEATAGHRVLLAEGLGWRSIAELHPGSVLVRPPTSSGIGPSTPDEDALHWTKTAPGFRSGCRRSLRSCGEPPLEDRGTGRDAPPSRVDAPARSHRDSSDALSGHGGGPEPTPSRSPAFPGAGLPSSSGDPDHCGSRSAEPGSHASCTASICAGSCSPNAPRLQRASPLLLQSSDADRRSASPSAFARDLPSDTSVVTSITFVRIDYHFDLYVPGHQSYVAAGAVHHNSGKSRGLKELTLAMALGGDHPLVKVWLATNQLPTDCIPDGPAEVYAVALTSNDSIRYHRPDFAQIVGCLPHTWHNLTGNGESRLLIHVPGYSKPAVIHFKSIDQKAKSFQGISLRWVWIDEEPEGHEGKAVYGQCRARVMDQDGKIGISMVPMNGFTWVYEDLVQKGQDHAVSVQLNALHNPFLPKKRAEDHFKGMSEAERAIRQMGDFRSRAGAIYPMWLSGSGNRWDSGHTCIPFPIPPHWHKFRAGDFGLDNPTAVVWAALSSDGDDDGTLYVYREYYRNGHSYPWHADRVLAIERGQEIDEETEDILGEPGPREVIEAGWGDPSALEGREAFCAVGVQMGLADNTLATGYSRMRDRLRLRSDLRPRIKVFTTCINTIREVSGLMRDPKRVDEIQIKRDDHAADALRYLVVGVGDWGTIAAW